MEEVDFITAVRNAAYNEHGAITCEVQFEGVVDTRGEPIWSPLLHILRCHGLYRQLYHDLVNGKYGTVSPFTVSPEMPLTAKAAKRQGKSKHGAQNRSRSRSRSNGTVDLECWPRLNGSSVRQ